MRGHEGGGGAIGFTALSKWPSIEVAVGFKEKTASLLKSLQQPATTIGHISILDAEDKQKNELDDFFS